MSDEQRMVLEFHRAFSIPVEPVPRMPDEAICALRMRLVQQACEALQKAFAQQDLVVTAQALAEVLYAVYGTALTCGLDMAPVFREVHRSNMTKVGVRQRADGTWERPPGYTPPRLEPILAALATGQPVPTEPSACPLPLSSPVDGAHAARSNETATVVSLPAAPAPRSPRPAAPSAHIYGTLYCPRCHKNFIRRAHRLGFRERFLGWMHCYPFRCLVCGYRFRAFHRRARAQPQASERRQMVRFAVQMPAIFVQTVKLGDERTGEGIVRDLTLGSCYLQTASPLSVGAVLTLTMQPGPDEPAIVVEVAVVQHVRPTGAGLTFLRLSESSQEQLAQYMDILLAQQTPAAAETESP